MKDTENVSVEKKLTLLKEFYETLDEYYRQRESYEKKKSLRSKLNRNLVAAKNAVIDSGAHRYSVEAINGVSTGNYIEPFDNLFMYENRMETLKNIMARGSFESNILNQIEQAIGVYEHIQSGSGLIELNPKEAIDIESAIERALRPSFRDGQPKSEKEVQDVIENILNSLGTDFTRERDTTSAGGKYYKPDFVIESVDLAIEVKLAKVGNGAAKIQEDLNADISGYRTKWKNLLFVIYDLGVIIDPYKFQTDNIKLFGVSVRVIKH